MEGGRRDVSDGPIASNKDRCVSVSNLVELAS